MLLNFILAWLDNLYVVGIFGVIFTIGYWLLSLKAWDDNNIDERELQWVTAVCSSIILFFLTIAVIPSPERLDEVSQLWNEKPLTTIVREIKNELPAHTSNTWTDLDIGGVHVLFRGY